VVFSGWIDDHEDALEAQEVMIKYNFGKTGRKLTRPFGSIPPQADVEHGDPYGLLGEVYV
jgi:hypothetical protein